MRTALQTTSLTARERWFTPLDVGWLTLAGHIVYGIAAGRLADRVSPNILVIAGLGIFAVAFF